MLIIVFLTRKLLPWHLNINGNSMKYYDLISLNLTHSHWTNIEYYNCTVTFWYKQHVVDPPSISIIKYIKKQAYFYITRPFMWYNIFHILISQLEKRLLHQPNKFMNSNTESQFFRNTIFAHVRNYIIDEK